MEIVRQENLTLVVDNEHGLIWAKITYK